MNRRLPWILLASIMGLAGAGCGTRAPLPTAETAFRPEDLAGPSKHARRFAGREEAVLVAVTDALVDCGYTLDRCDRATGLISASVQQMKPAPKSWPDLFGVHRAPMPDYTERVSIIVRPAGRAECEVHASWRRTYWQPITGAYSHQTDGVDDARSSEIFTAISRRLALPAVPQ